MRGLKMEMLMNSPRVEVISSVVVVADLCSILVFGVLNNLRNEGEENVFEELLRESHL